MKGEIYIRKRLYIDNQPAPYFIYDDGRVYSETTEKFLKPFPNPQGYMLVDIHINGVGYTKQLHRLVAMAFIPNPDMLETVNHKDGDKTHNYVDNLEWMTRLDNVRHAWATGLAKPKYGTDNPANVYTEEQIHLVCQLLEIGGRKYTEISALTGVNVTTIYDVRIRSKWKHISEQYDIPKTIIGFRELRAQILDLMRRGYSNKEIVEILELPEKAKKHIKYVRSIFRNSLNDYSGDGSTPVSK